MTDTKIADIARVMREWRVTSSDRRMVLRNWLRGISPMQRLIRFNRLSEARRA